MRSIFVACCVIYQIKPLSQTNTSQSLLDRRQYWYRKWHVYTLYESLKHCAIKQRVYELQIPIIYEAFKFEIQENLIGVA